MRTLLLLITLLIAAGAFVIQGPILSALIRLVKPQMTTGDIPEEERARLLEVMGSALMDTVLTRAIHEADGKTLLSAGVLYTLFRLGHVPTDEATGERTWIAHVADRILMDTLQDTIAQEGMTRDGLCPECADDDFETAATCDVESDGGDNDGHGTVGMSEEEVERSLMRDQIRELALEVIHAQRDTLLRAHDESVFPSAALEGTLVRLDNEEVPLVSSRGVDN